MVSNIKINNIILKKSKKSFYRICITFSLVWLVILSYIAFCVFYIFNNIQNFHENDMAHVIEVKGRIEATKYEKLVENDLSCIDKLFVNKKIEYNSIPICKIATGIIDEETQEGIILYGIMKDNILMSNDEGDNTFYSNINKEKINLIIPEISIDLQGHISSNKFNILEFNIKAIDNFIIESIIKNNQISIDTYFCNKNTYTQVLNKMYINDNISKIDLEEIIIYISNIDDITSAKIMLEENDYFVSYAFGAFEDLPSFITKSSFMLIIVLIILIIFSMIYIFISYKNYMNVQKKDIGVIKHFGYKVDKILNIYLWSLKLITLFLIVLSIVFNILLYIDKLVFIITSVGMMVLALVMYNMIKYCVIKKIVKKDILYLIKYNKEFE